MELYNLLMFAAAYLAVVILPGPSVAALVARVLARGTSGVSSFIAGIVAGALVWFNVAALGLAALAAVFSPVLVVVRYAGAAYLLYLAWKLWRAPVRPMTDASVMSESGARLFWAGLAINLGNPKAVAFFLALLPTVVDLSRLTPVGILELSAVIVVVVASVFGAYALAADRARRVFRSEKSLKTINRGSGLIMAGAAVTIAAR
jgi:threonine/homoserine/homoserine lactone efflux protein